jgi:hypothetical protein
MAGVLGQPGRALRGRLKIRQNCSTFAVDRARIVAVHANKDAVTRALGVTSATVCAAVKYGYNTKAGTKLVNYDELDDAVKAEYVGHVPDEVSHMTHARSVGVRRIDQRDGVVAEYASLSAAVSANPGVTVKPLKNALLKGSVYQGAVWQHLQA